MTFLFLVLQIPTSSRIMLQQKQFQCTLCQDVLTDPVTTPCGHNFCRTCIQSFWDSGDVCRCPTCNKTFPSRPEISINAAFKELADTFRRTLLLPSSAPLLSAAGAGDVACDVCATACHHVKALKSCLVCLTSYCEAHLEPHRRVATLKLHKLLDPVKNLQDRMCKRHERLLEMFCRDDQTCVCQFCTETEHKGHQAVTIEEESGERKVLSLMWVKDTSTETNIRFHKFISIIVRAEPDFHMWETRRTAANHPSSWMQ